MFLFKKIVAPLFFPLSLCLEILIVVILLTSKQNTGKIIVTISVATFVSLSYGIASETLLRSLEYKYPPLIDVSTISNVKWVQC